MVDFQSRDTTRGLSSDDDEDEDEGEAEEAESAEAGARETPGEDETAGAETGTPERAGTGEVEETAAEADSSETPPTAESGGGTPTAEAGGTAEAPAGADALGADTDADRDAHEREHDATHDHEGGHSHADHHHGDVEELGVAVVTVSSSRDLDADPSGDAIQSLVEGDGHSMVARDLVPDDLDGVQRAVLALTGREDVDVVVTTGGTGVTPDDVTVEAVRPLFDKELPGFGELFRILSYEEVGTRALGSRATAGVSEGVPVFCLPGSEDAVRTGVEELILAEAPHLVGLANGE